MPERVPVLLLALCLSISAWLIREADVAAYKAPAPACEANTSARTLVQKEQASSMSFQRLHLGTASTPHWLSQRMELLAQQVSTSHGDGLPWRVTVLKSSSMNAFSGANGEIQLTSALLKSGLTKDELTAVLAHEISHVVLEHALKRHCAGKSSEKARSMPHLHEMEADVLAQSLLTKAGLGPRAMEQLLMRLSQLAQRGNQASKTHPAYQERISSLKAK